MERAKIRDHLLRLDREDRMRRFGAMRAPRTSPPMASGSTGAAP
jgi:hypothetical protein